MSLCRSFSRGGLVFFFFNDTATTEIYTLSLHDALPISPGPTGGARRATARTIRPPGAYWRSEEHTSELQSPCNLVCRLLLEKKKNNYNLWPRWFLLSSVLLTAPTAVPSLI